MSASLATTESGHRFDQDTGLHYNRYRDYDPKLARFAEGKPADTDKMIAIRILLRELDARDEAEPWAAADQCNGPGL